MSGVVLTLTDMAGRQVDVGRTGRTGAYELSANTVGEHVLLATAGSTRPAVSTVHLNGNARWHDLLLDSQGTISGRVRVAGRHAAVAGAVLILTDRLGTVTATHIAGGDGAYRFTGIEPGAYTLTVSAHGYTPHAETMTVGDGAAAQHDVELSQAADREFVRHQGTLSVD